MSGRTKRFGYQYLIQVLSPHVGNPCTCRIYCESCLKLLATACYTNEHGAQPNRLRPHCEVLNISVFIVSRKTGGRLPPAPAPPASLAAACRRSPWAASTTHIHIYNVSTTHEIKQMKSKNIALEVIPGKELMLAGIVMARGTQNG